MQTHAHGAQTDTQHTSIRTHRAHTQAYVHAHTHATTYTHTHTVPSLLGAPGNGVTMTLPWDGN